MGKKNPTWMSLTLARRKELYLSSCKMILGHFQAKRNQDGLLLLFSETEVKWYNLQNLGKENCSQQGCAPHVPDWWAHPCCPLQSSATEDKSLERWAQLKVLTGFVLAKKTEKHSKKTEISRTGDIMTAEETTRHHWCPKKRNSVRRR